MLSTQSIKQIPTTSNRVFAFEIAGQLSKSDLEAMGQYMNDAFDVHNSLNMLLKFENYDGSEAGAGLNAEMAKAQFRALKNVDTYVVVGAPDSASSLIDFFSPLIPVEAQAYPMKEEHEAWAQVGAAPLG